MMKTHENIASKNSVTSSIQDVTVTNDISVPNGLFNNLIKKQVNEFKEFNSHEEEYLVQPNENIIKMKNDPIEIEKVCKKYEERIVFQTQLIDSLKARVEELETDSIIKNQDIKRLQHEIDDFKKEILSVLDPPALNSKNNVSLNRNRDENGRDFEIQELNDQFNESLACSEMFGEFSRYNKHSQQEPYISPVSVKHIYNNNEQIHNEVRKFLDKHKNRVKPFKLRTFDYLEYNFSANDFLGYEKTELFESLSNDIKNCIRSTINKMLGNELSSKRKKNKISQPINVYVDRMLIPSLPAGVKSYSEFQQTGDYDLLSRKMKKRIRKVISQIE